MGIERDAAMIVEFFDCNSNDDFQALLEVLADQDVWDDEPLVEPLYGEFLFEGTYWMAGYLDSVLGEGLGFYAGPNDDVGSFVSMLNDILGDRDFDYYHGVVTT